jgi:hypothetical protein
MPSRDFSPRRPANVALDLVHLFKALGGGWKLTFPDPPFRLGSSALNGKRSPRAFSSESLPRT